MSRKRHTAEEIVNKLRQADVDLSKGATIALACKAIGVTEQTYYRCLLRGPQSVAVAPG